VFDGSEPLCNEDYNTLRSIPRGIPALTVVNKSDLPRVLTDGELAALGVDYCRVCALTSEGLGALEAEIKKIFPELGAAPTGELITNARQAEAISRARDCVIRAIAAINASVTPDAVLTEIEAALTAIGEITGNTMREDIVSRIFERFCVGK
jgi:tRNA modification GTPase